jgi:hypothetical protein
MAFDSEKTPPCNIVCIFIQLAIILLQIREQQIPVEELFDLSCLILFVHRRLHYLAIVQDYYRYPCQSPMLLRAGCF